MEQVVEVAQQTQRPIQDAPAVPAVQTEDKSAQPEQQVGQEGAEKQVEKQEETETPQRRESRRQRQLNRERERRIAAETELRLFREQQQARQEQKQPPADDAPKREQFDSYEEYLRADARYIAVKEAKETARREAEALRKEHEASRSRETEAKRASEWNAKIEKARDAVYDFDEVCAESEAIVTGPMASAIQESDQGALIAYYLAKNPAEAERISKLSSSKQAAAIVGLEEKVSKPAKQPSSAPEPISPVGKKAEVEKDPAKMSDSEYAAYRKRRRAAKGLT